MANDRTKRPASGHYNDLAKIGIFNQIEQDKIVLLFIHNTLITKHSYIAEKLEMIFWGHYCLKRTDIFLPDTKNHVYCRISVVYMDDEYWGPWPWCIFGHFYNVYM